MTARRMTPFLVLSLIVCACSGSDRSQRARAAHDAHARSRSIGQEDGGRCEASTPDREESEYDTSGDDVPDVRKVFLRVGQPPVVRLVLICREADLNGDGIKDVVRYYNDEGRPQREESDRNFDGQMDEITTFEEGAIMEQAFDMNHDGRVDTKIFFEEGRPFRAERDLAGRSTGTSWRPDRWEYFEGGRMVRMGTDLDGDGSVDRWDRNQELRRQLQEQGETQTPIVGTDIDAQAGGPPES